VENCGNHNKHGLRCAISAGAGRLPTLTKTIAPDVMSALLSYSGANLHLVIITQTTSHFFRSFIEKVGVHYIRTDDLRLHVNDIYRYCQLCGLAISGSKARQLYHYTEGWIVALYLTILQIQRGEGFSPGLGILRLMESIVWENTNNQMKKLLLQLAPFSDVTITQVCFLFQADPLPEDVLNLLDETPFIRYEAGEQRYMLWLS
jgi:LuxR family maltose regulon positive regulatory protein